MIQLVDDKVLSELLQGRAAPHPQPDQAVFTTGCWYARLCQAAFSSEISGVLSDAFRQLPPHLRSRAMESLLDLPTEIGLVSLRTLAPLIGQLRNRHRQLNLLSIEALAAAVHLDADVWLSTPSPRLQEALVTEGREAVVVE